MRPIFISQILLLITIGNAAAQQDTVRCSWPEKDGKRISILTTREDCQKHIEKAQADAKARPLYQPKNIVKVTRDAIQRYCASATSIACNLYVRKVSQCPSLASDAYSILGYERTAMMRMRATPRQAAELAVNAFSKTSTLPSDVIVEIANHAASFPSSEDSEVFRDRMLERCITVPAD